MLLNKKIIMTFPVKGFFGIKNMKWKKMIRKDFFISLVTRDSKIQWFQARIIHKILAANSFLHKIKMINSPLCTFCIVEFEKKIITYSGNVKQLKKSWKR